MDDSNIKMYFNGCGNYGDINKFAFEPQAVMLELVRKLFQGPMKNLQNDEGAFVVADFGTADGAGFMHSLPAIIGLIRSQYGPEKEVSVVFNDGPENDFTSVFRYWTGMAPCTGAQKTSSFELYDNVFVTACGRSFFRQCLPNKTLSLGCSTTALHFLSQVPCLIGECSSTLIDGIRAEPFERQAEVDWENFLLFRAKELKSGGALALLVIGIDEEHRYPGVTRPGTISIWKLLSDTWRELCTQSVITNEEVRQSTFPMHMRTQEELLKPFATDQSPVQQAGLRLISMKGVLVDSPYYPLYLQDLKTGAKHQADMRYAVALATSIKSWSYFLFYYGLSHSRTVEQKEEIMIQYFDLLTENICKDPSSYIFDYVYNSVLIVKE